MLRLCLENVAGIDVFESLTYQLANKEYLIANLQYPSCAIFLLLINF